MARTQSVAGPSGSKTAKPYDRPSAKAKGKQPASALPAFTAPQGVNQGAPSQTAQSSRKGKKAWRKNIDITSEEVALEAAREEERITGGKASDKSNSQLFTVDVVGDVEVKAKVRRAHKPLRSLAVLNERSAVPSLTSRATASTSASAAKSITKLSSAQKDRLRRIARRNVIGADGEGLGSADIKMTPTAESLRDAWDASLEPAPPALKGDFGVEGVVRVKPQAPVTLQRQRAIRERQIKDGQGVEVPVGGVSYNPTQESHEALLKTAVEEELGKLTKEERDAQEVALFAQGAMATGGLPAVPGGEYVDGMLVGPGEQADSGSADEEDGEAAPVKKPTKRKTQAQRNKAARRIAKAQEEAHARHLAKLHKSVASAQELKRREEARLKKLAEDEERRRLLKAEKERQGLVGGEKIGKHRVPKASVDVQLGEDLAETLRQLKPEGNLFKDRYLALQKKQLVEPRVKQLPKRRVRKTKEYEKHAWKRFQ